MAQGYLAQVFRTLNAPVQSPSEHVPFLNSVNSTFSGYLSAVGQVAKKRKLMSWYKAIPELTGIVNKVARDVIYKFHFEPVNPGESGRNKVMLANKFSKMVELRKVMLGQIIDILVTGEGFAWMGKLDKKKVRSVIDKRLKKEIFMSQKEQKEIADRLMLEFKFTPDMEDYEGIDEDLLKPRLYRHVASSTVEVQHDQYDIIKYVQAVGVNQQSFTPDEIIRFTQMDVDGKVGGFSPVESIIVQLELLRQMWQNMLSLHRNGGHPDKIFILENEQVSTPSYKRIEEQLLKYKLVENKHGNLLFTGKVTVQDLNQVADMQFKDEGLYITGLIAMQWQVPKSSIPYIVGGTNTKDDTGGNSEKGYWRNIEILQEDFADTMNTQLWIPYFGVRLVFDDTFTNQDIQIHTAEQLKLNNLKVIDELLGKAGKKMSTGMRLKKIGLSEEDVEDDDDPYEYSGTGMDMQLPSDEVVDSTDKRNISKRKAEEQRMTTNAQGKKPSGRGV